MLPAPTVPSDVVRNVNINGSRSYLTSHISRV